MRGFEIGDVVYVDPGAHYLRARGAMRRSAPSPAPVGVPLVVRRVYPDGDLGLTHPDPATTGWWAVSPAYVQAARERLRDIVTDVGLRVEQLPAATGRLHPEDIENIALRVFELLRDTVYDDRPRAVGEES